jgi:hypothetical protein
VQREEVAALMRTVLGHPTIVAADAELLFRSLDRVETVTRLEP